MLNGLGIIDLIGEEFRWEMVGRGRGGFFKLYLIIKPGFNGNDFFLLLFR